MPSRDFLADPRTGRLPVERLNQFLADSGQCSSQELQQATTKFALVSLAEAKGVDLEAALVHIPPTPASSQRRRPQTPKAAASSRIAARAAEAAAESAVAEKEHKSVRAAQKLTLEWTAQAATAAAQADAEEAARRATRPWRDHGVVGA